MKKGKISLLLGLLGGTALGVLFAPHKGIEIRKKIKKEREEGGSGLNTVKKEFTLMGKEIIDCCEDACPDKIHEGIDKGKEQLQEWAKYSKEELEQLALKAQEKADELKKILEKKKGSLQREVRKAHRTAKTRLNKAKRTAKKVTAPARKKVKKMMKEAEKFLNEEEKK